MDHAASVSLGVWCGVGVVFVGAEMAVGGVPAAGVVVGQPGEDGPATDRTAEAGRSLFRLQASRCRTGLEPETEELLSKGLRP